MKIIIEAAPAELRAGLAELQAESLQHFARAGGCAVRFAKTAGTASLTVRQTTGRVTIEYRRPIDAFRALGRLLGGGRDFSETCKFTMLGAMIDCSRNAVLRPDAAEAFIRRLALMGINVLMLYTEDTYEVPGEPMFGYLRGAYTPAELRRLDRYAAKFGIEMFPCIQALGHLEQILQWPAYRDYVDNTSVLLAKQEKTYLLLEKMIRAASAPFRSKRIHIGMDEAHGIGSGRYRELYGEKSAFDILNAHLARVRKICLGLGLRPMIWSDMYFRIGSKTHNYYDLKADIPRKVIAQIPKGVELVYWDYYHHDVKFYTEFIKRHRALGSEPIMAGGAWTWSRFWTLLPKAFSVTDACMTACKKQHLREVFLTLWGDDGNEYDIFSALPALQHFAEHGYADKVDDKLLRANFRGACDADFDVYCRAATLDTFAARKYPEPLDHYAANPSKWILWQDPALGLLDPQIDKPEAHAAHFAKLARALPTTGRLEFPARMAATLAIKTTLRQKLVTAYKSGNRRQLTALMNGDLVRLQKAVDELWKCHRAMWLATYKPFGLEVLERRYGGLQTRLASLRLTLRDYLAGKTPSIPEFETKLVKAYQGPTLWHNFWTGRAASPSCIK
ncbi:MAG: hypothetical protein PCFJNLEI_00064 [Verrucomicrobiae bacterium]|nr:hypothetical protein [Verrucomicrobiae bacterium]